MNRKLKLAGAVASAAIFGLALSACSGSDASGGGDDGGLTLTIWHNSADTEAILNLYKAYEEESGNKLDLVPISSDGFEEATLSKWASGDRPDILEFHALPAIIDQLNGAQNLQDLSDMEFVKKSGDLYKVGGFGADGNIYAAITSFPEIWGLYYSKPVLEQFGLKPATTQAELMEQCKILSAAGVPTLAEAGGSIWPPQAIPLVESGQLAPDDWTQQVIDQKTTIDAADSPVLEGIQGFQDLLDAGCMDPAITTDTFQDSVAKVYNGEAAYQALHSNISTVYLDEAGGDGAALDKAVGFQAFGADERGTAVNPGPIGTYLLPKTGDEAKEKAAREFVEFATGAHYQTYVDESGTFPVIEGTNDPTDVTPLMTSVKAAYDEGPTFGFVNGRIPGGMQGFAALLSELIAGQKTPKEVATALQGQAATAAKAQGLEGW